MSRRRHVARAELVLSRSDRFPLKMVGLRPDPLRDLVMAIGSVDHDDGESAEVVVDVLPVTPAERRRWARGSAPGGRGTGMSGLAGQFADGFGISHGAGRNQRPTRSGLQRFEDKAIERKTIPASTAFWVQVLCRTESFEPGRSEALLQQLLAGFDVFTGENGWRSAGRRVGGVFIGGSDSWWHRRMFDQRFDTGEFKPRKRQILTATELAGVLKPPTASCPDQYVARTAGVIPPPPRRLLTWKEGGKDLLPLGIVSTPKGERPIAVRLSETQFAYNSGRSGYGKTQSALGRFIAIAEAGHGAMYLDPHGDAIDRAKHYLGHLGDRVEEINLAADPTHLQAGWNPISMEGLAPHQIETKVSAVVDSFASALNWGEINNRALTLTTMAVQSLCELSVKLPDEVSPTLFQITSILADDAWRDAVVPHLSTPAQDFWRTRFPKLSSDAITPVTNLIDRLRSSPTVAALFGSSRSTYDIRRSMDDGRIVLWSTAGTGAWATLVNCFITYDLFRAAMSRRSLAEADRRPFFAFIDELQRVSGTGSGSAGESVARALEEARKMGLKLMLMSQQPTRLARPTLEAIFTNRSHLLSHVVSAESAKQITKEWGGQIDADTLTRLPKYHFIAQVTLDGELTTPFLVRGFDLDELWAHRYRDDVTDLDRAVDANLHRRPVGEVLAELNTLDDRIIDALDGLSPRDGGGRDRFDELHATFDNSSRASGHSTAFESPRFDPGDLDEANQLADRSDDGPFDDDAGGVVTPLFSPKP